MLEKEKKNNEWEKITRNTIKSEDETFSYKNWIEKEEEKK